MQTPFINNHQLKITNLLIPATVIILTIAIGFGSYSSNPFFRKMDLFFYDMFMKTFALQDKPSKITIIDIDETSLSAVGQWPWPRYRLASLIKTIHDMQPKTIGLDIFLPEPDRTSLNNIKKQFQNDFDLNIGFTGVPSSLSDNDGYLAHILKTSNIVGARYFYFDHFNKEKSCKFNPFSIKDHSGLLTLHKATGILCNALQIEESLAYTGFTNNQHDSDGIIRQTPLLLEFEGEIFTHLSFSTFLKAHGIKHASILKNFYGLYIQAGKYKIPITKNGYIRMQFSGPARDHKFISALDILNNNYAKSDIENRIVFIGSSAIGLNDLHHTIFDSQFPGVAIHAVIIDNILKNQEIIQPIWSRHSVFGLCIVTGIIMMFLLIKTSSPIALFLGTFIWICTLLITSVISYTKLLVFISPGLPVLISLTHFSLFSYVRFAIARQISFKWFKKLAGSQQLAMEAMVSMVETRDPETGQHIKRTQHYARALAQYLKSMGLFSDQLTDNFIEILFIAVPLHDIGKVGIPDRILLKPGKLTHEEFEFMKLHTSYGKDTIFRVSDKIKGDHYLKTGAQIAGSHHERWDGTGYPNGLSKENIPLSGRIMAICDVYDALISRRCYKPPFPHKKSMEIIMKGRGSKFDPVIVDAFFAIETEIKTIALEYRDKIEEAPEIIKKLFMDKIFSNRYEASNSS